MSKIELTNGKHVLVDESDLERINKLKWRESDNGYAVTTKPHKGKYVKMHRMIMNPPKNMHVDHMNGDKLDNRKTNLRVCTPKQNASNRRKFKNNASKYKGVTRKSGRWRATITHDGKSKDLGLYDTEEEAAYKYNLYALKYFGEYASLNDVPLSKEKKEQVEWEFKLGFKQRKARKNSKTGVRGISVKPNGKFEVNVNIKGDRVYLGVFEDIKEAEQEIKRCYEESFTVKVSD